MTLPPASTLVSGAVAKPKGIKGWPPYLASYHVNLSHDLKCPDWRIQMVQHILSQGNGNYKIDRGMVDGMRLLSTHTFAGQICTWSF